MGAIVKTVGQLVLHLTRRGRGVFKLFFIVDDFFRIFTMTILIPIFLTWLGVGDIIRLGGMLLGIVIDFHDFVTEFGLGKGPVA